MSAILSVQGLSVQFGALKAVHDVSFEAQPGRITAVIGPNGAGKSSLFNLISGAIRPTAGSVRFDDQDVTAQPPHRLLASGLSRSFQITNLFFDLSVRENLRLGASQIKIAAGGGTSSEYDPLDVTQYTLDEMKAAVDAASDWNTYVTVHAYHPKSVRRAIEAGVKVIEHGNLLDEDTLKLMAEKGIWLSGQMLVDSTEAMDPKRREKRKPVIEGQKIVWPMAKRLGVKLAWGTDFLFEPDLNAQQNAYILRLKPYFTAAELLRLVTSGNAELLALSGPRTPYEGRLGVVAQGALADLILVRGDPLADIELIGDPAANFTVIMKDGKVVKGP